ncbi:MAG TPA: ACT domain-containing protein [Candidatus Aquilonibacter sp.]|nr:ACT domain-containing protein [Candidatus Aquilonibacter sp.]
MSAPERDLNTLLITMKPALDPREWVYCSVDKSFLSSTHRPLFVFHESEGTTVVVERNVAESLELPYTYVCRRITLRVHSDLEAVGFISTVTTTLAKHMISTNVVSAFYHDHIFVPLDRAEEALHVLETLSAERARSVL